MSINEFKAYCLEYISLCNEKAWNQADECLEFIADVVDEDYERLCPIMEAYGITY